MSDLRPDTDKVNEIFPKGSEQKGEGEDNEFFITEKQDGEPHTIKEMKS